MKEEMRVYQWAARMTMMAKIYLIIAVLSIAMTGNSWEQGNRSMDGAMLVVLPHGGFNLAMVVFIAVAMALFSTYVLPESLMVLSLRVINGSVKRAPIERRTQVAAAMGSTDHD